MQAWDYKAINGQNVAVSVTNGRLSLSGTDIRMVNSQSPYGSDTGRVSFSITQTE